MTESVLNAAAAKAEADRWEDALVEANKAVEGARIALEERRIAAIAAENEWKRAHRVYRMLSGQWGKRKKAKEGAETPE